MSDKNILAIYPVLIDHIKQIPDIGRVSSNIEFKKVTNDEYAPKHKEIMVLWDGIKNDATMSHRKRTKVALNFSIVLCIQYYDNLDWLEVGDLITKIIQHIQGFHPEDLIAEPFKFDDNSGIIDDDNFAFISLAFSSSVIV